MAWKVRPEWDPRKHPRGRDGRFIEVFGLLKMFDDPKGHETNRVVRVERINPNGKMDVIVTASRRGDVGQRYQNVPSIQLTHFAKTPKARLNSPGQGTTPDEDRELLEAEAQVPQIRERRIPDVDGRELRVGDRVKLLNPGAFTPEQNQGTIRRVDDLQGRAVIDFDDGTRLMRRNVQIQSLEAPREDEDEIPGIVSPRGDQPAPTPDATPEPTPEPEPVQTPEPEAPNDFQDAVDRSAMRSVRIGETEEAGAFGWRTTDGRTFTRDDLPGYEATLDDDLTVRVDRVGPDGEREEIANYPGGQFRSAPNSWSNARDVVEADASPGTPDAVEPEDDDGREPIPDPGENPAFNNASPEYRDASPEERARILEQYRHDRDLYELDQAGVSRDVIDLLAEGDIEAFTDALVDDPAFIAARDRASDPRNRAVEFERNGGGAARRWDTLRRISLNPNGPPDSGESDPEETARNLVPDAEPEITLDPALTLPDDGPPLDAFDLDDDTADFIESLEDDEITALVDGDIHPLDAPTAVSRLDEALDEGVAEGDITRWQARQVRTQLEEQSELPRPRRTADSPATVDATPAPAPARAPAPEPPPELIRGPAPAPSAPAGFRAPPGVNGMMRSPDGQYELLRQPDGRWAVDRVVPGTGRRDRVGIADDPRGAAVISERDRESQRAGVRGEAPAASAPASTDADDEVDTPPQFPEVALTQDERDAIVEYAENFNPNSGMMAYEQLNGALRGERDPDGLPWQMDDYSQALQADLDSAIAKSENPAFTAWRGLALPAGHPLADQLQPGTRLRDNGFMSTSYDRTIPVDFMEGGSGAAVRFRIDVPAGRGIGLPVRGNGPDQGEILLARGSEIEIESVERGPNGEYEVRARFIPRGQGDADAGAAASDAAGRGPGVQDAGAGAPGADDLDTGADRGGDAGAASSANVGADINSLADELPRQGAGAVERNRRNARLALGDAAGYVERGRPDSDVDNALQRAHNYLTAAFENANPNQRRELDAQRRRIDNMRRQLAGEEPLEDAPEPDAPDATDTEPADFGTIEASLPNVSYDEDTPEGFRFRGNQVESLNYTGFLTHEETGRNYFVKKNEDEDFPDPDIDTYVAGVERDASLLLHRAGVTGTPITRVGPDGITTISEYAGERDGVVRLQTFGERSATLDSMNLAEPDDLIRTFAFDSASGNSDRHSGNIMVGFDADGRGHLYPIDNGFSFSKFDDFRGGFNEGTIAYIYALREHAQRIGPEETNRIYEESLEGIRAAAPEAQTIDPVMINEKVDQALANPDLYTWLVG